jgi:hypothetical protein
MREAVAVALALDECKDASLEFGDRGDRGTACRSALVAWAREAVAGRMRLGVLLLGACHPKGLLFRCGTCGDVRRGACGGDGGGAVYSDGGSACGACGTRGEEVDFGGGGDGGGKRPVFSWAQLRNLTAVKRTIAGFACGAPFGRPLRLLRRFVGAVDHVLAAAAAAAAERRVGDGSALLVQLGRARPHCHRPGPLQSKRRRVAPEPTATGSSSSSAARSDGDEFEAGEVGESCSENEDQRGFEAGAEDDGMLRELQALGCGVFTTAK